MEHLDGVDYRSVSDLISSNAEVTLNREFWFIATHRFDRSTGDAWKSYVKFSGLSQLEAVVSLDSLLNPKVILETIDDDWEYKVHKGPWTCFFRDLKYLLQRLGPRVTKSNVLGVILEPAADCAHLHPVPENTSAFDFAGYDLVDGPGGMSALANCSGFDEVLRPEEQNELGLILSFARAKELQGLLRKTYPEHPHAHCSLVAIWLLRQNLL